MADDTDEPQNRRARRAVAKATGKAVAPATTAPRIKLVQPDYSKPQTKTLLDVYNDKQHLLAQGQPFDSKHTDGRARDEQRNVLGPASEELVGPVADAVFWSISLAMLHFTLDVLAQNQYRQELDWHMLISRSGLMLPILWLSVLLLHSRTTKRWPLVRQAFFAVAAIAVGNYTITVANKDSYYAVMKQVPPLGTLWIWTVIEMDVLWAVASVGVNLGFLLWKGYTVF